MLSGRHIMVDLETLGTSVNTIALQVGACEWNPQTGEITRWFSQYVSIASAMAVGRTLDPDTILYWMDMEDDARKRMIEGLRDKALPLSEVLYMLADFMQTSNGRMGLGRKMEMPEGVWSHGLTFDVPIIQESMAACGIKQAFDFRDCLDTRTIFKLSGKRLSQYDDVVNSRWPDTAPPRVKHDALSDAIAQALAISEALKAIQRI